MGQLVHHTHSRTPSQDRIDVQLFGGAAPVYDALQGNDLQSLQLVPNVAAPMGLHKSDHHIHPAGLQLPGVFQHLIGLPDTRSIAEINFEVTSNGQMCHGSLLFVLVWKDPNVHTFSSPDQTAHGSSPQARPPIVLHAVPNKNLGDAVGPRILHDGFDRIVGLQARPPGRRRRGRAPDFFHFLVLLLG